MDHKAGAGVGHRDIPAQIALGTNSGGVALVIGRRNRRVPENCDCRRHGVSRRAGRRIAVRRKGFHPRRRSARGAHYDGGAGQGGNCCRPSGRSKDAVGKTSSRQVDHAAIVVHGRSAVAPRDSVQAKSRIPEYTREISGSIDDGVAVRGGAKATSTVGARLDDSGIRPSSSVYVDHARGGRAGIGYARVRAWVVRKSGRPYRVGVRGAGRAHYARCRNGGHAADGVEEQCGGWPSSWVACNGNRCIIRSQGGRKASARGGAGANGHGLVDCTRSDEYLDARIKRDVGGGPGVTDIDARQIIVAARRAGRAAGGTRALRERRFR